MPQSYDFHNSIDAQIWLDTSAEQHALYIQAFELAKLRISDFLKNPDPAAAGKRLCVITDCDETILDNSAFNAWLTRWGRSFNLVAWNEYCNARISLATAGAVDYARWVRAQSVEIFYVTSREYVARKATADNLAQLGFPIPDEDKADDPAIDPVNPSQSLARLFVRDTKINSATTGKYEQYKFIEEKMGFYPILWTGDNLGDFASTYRFSSHKYDHAKRLSEASTTDLAKWGKRWIVMPNPVYGDFLTSLVSADGSKKNISDDGRDLYPGFDYKTNNPQIRDEVDPMNNAKINLLSLWNRPKP